MVHTWYCRSSGIPTFYIQEYLHRCLSLLVCRYCNLGILGLGTPSIAKQRIKARWQLHFAFYFSLITSATIRAQDFSVSLSMSTVRPCIKKYLIFHFVSPKVPTSIVICPIKTFRFQNGSIKRFCKLYRVLLLCVFQFHTASIKSDSSLSEVSSVYAFQFHTASLRKWLSAISNRLSVNAYWFQIGAIKRRNRAK